MGQSSPPATIYSPKSDREYKNVEFSVGQSRRFIIPKSIERVWKAVPHQYSTIKDGLDGDNKRHNNYNFHQTTLGYGEKSDFTNQKEMS